MKYPRYPAYRESGVPWHGKTPKHWKIQRLKWAATRCTNGVWGSEADGDDDLICVRVADFDRNKFTVDLAAPTLRSIPSGDRPHRMLKRGDILLEKSGGGDTQIVGAVVQYLHPEPAVCSNFIAKMTALAGVHSRFLVYLHAHLYSSNVTSRSVNQSTGIQNLDSSAYLSERIALPPSNEQEIIANFLDSETTRIDALITKKRELIERLKEQRAALITHAVTKGLNSSAEFQESGVTSLGSIPKHWHVRGLTKALTNIVDYRGATPEKTLDGVFLVTTRNIRDGKIDYETSREFVDPDSYEDIMRRGKLAMGDVLFTMEAPLGEVATVDRTDVAIAQRIIKLTPRKSLLTGDFLKYWIMGAWFKGDVTSYSTGSTATGIKASKLPQLKVAIPPLPEQEVIVDHIALHTSAIDATISRAQEIIAVLTEYRSAIISDAVTGKIDVRESLRNAA